MSRKLIDLIKAFFGVPDDISFIYKNPSSNQGIESIDGNRRKCYRCNGTGLVDNSDVTYKCSTRYGRYSNVELSSEYFSDCPVCNGTGYIYDKQGE